ncbi:MAG: lmo0937 family membrane protein [Bacteroidota bacterium]
MGNILYTIAVILVIFWAIGFLGYNAGGLIHILLVIAVIAVLIRLIQGKRPV